MSEVTISPKYKNLFNALTRYFIVTGGRGSGKSFTVTLFLLFLTFEKGHKILFTRYTMVSAKDSIIPQFLEVMEVLGYTNDHFEVTLDTITNKQTGSSIIFKGIKTSSGIQTAKLKSLTGITTFVLDEAEELVEENIFDKINLSVRVKGVQNRVILIMNPATKTHWIYNRFFLEDYPNTTYIHTTYQDNLKNLNEDVLNEIEHVKQKDPEKYKHVILGGWMDKAEGVVFKNWTTGEFPNHLSYCYGLDFGWSPDPTAIVKVAIDEKDRKIYAEEKAYANELSNDEISNLLNSILDNPRDMIVADHEPKTINYLRTQKKLNVHPADKGKDSVRIGVKDMLSYEIVVCGKSKNLKTELNNYVWNDKQAGIPVKAYGHLIDAIRYAKFRLSRKVFVK